MTRVVSLLVCLIASGASAQSFEGKIIYSNTFLSKDGQDISEQIIPLYGREQHYYIKANNYKSTTEDGRLTQLYQGKTNTYHIVSLDSTVQPLNAAIPSEPVQEVYYLDTMVTILENKCRLVRLNTSTSTTIYFFSRGYQVDPGAFENHNFGNFTEYLKASRGELPLEYISINQDYIHIAEAIAIESGPLEDDEFQLPPEYILKED